MPVSLSHDPAVLGRILLLQSAVQAAPDEQRLAEVIVSGLADLPGVAECSIRMGEIRVSSPGSSVTPNMEWDGLLHRKDASMADPADLRRFPLQTVRHDYGELSVLLSEHGDAFTPYEPFVANTANLVALYLEMYQTEADLNALNRELESKVKERTAELRESEEWHRRILRTAMEGFWLVDLHGRLLEVNDTYCRMSGYSESELVSMHVSDLECIETSDDIAARIRVIMQEEEQRFESRHRRKDGTVFDVEVSVQYRPEKGGRFVCFLRDITERKQAEKVLRQTADDLERSNKDLGHFAYVASHDLQEPLRTITSFVQLLARRCDDLDEEAREYVHYAVDGAARMSNLLRDLLDYSVIGRTRNPFVAVDLEEVLGEVEVMLHGPIAETGAAITHDPLPVVQGDPTQLRQLLHNLIDNAIKYRREEEPPRVRVTAREEDEKWVFSVVDNGIGFDPAYAGKIFEIFQRLHSPARYQGSGVGLAICKRIVEHHGGVMGATSEPGRGSTFTFSLGR